MLDSIFEYIKVTGSKSVEAIMDLQVLDLYQKYFV